MEAVRRERSASAAKQDVALSAVQGLGPGALAFLRHWESIRRSGELVPDIDVWIDNLTGALALHVFRGELQRNDCILLFAGSWLMARDALGNPGESVYVRYPWSKPWAKEASVSNLRTMVQHPCGYRLDLKARDGTKCLQAVMLPLRALPGRRPQLVSYIDLIEGAPDIDIANHCVDRQVWIDVGAGTPREPPNEEEIAAQL